jgi:hypothetical protein
MRGAQAITQASNMSDFRGGRRSVNESFMSMLEELAVIARNGLAYTKDQHDLERFQRIRSLASEMMAQLSGISHEDVNAWRSPESGYATPKLDVRGAVLRSRRQTPSSTGFRSHWRVDLRSLGTDPRQ